MAADVELFVKTCQRCSVSKKPARKAKAKLGTFHAGVAMERVHIDILGPFPKSTRGNVYILVIVDQFTKWVECFAIPDQNAETVAKVVVEGFIARFGCPLQIHTDQGRNFTGNLFSQVCQLLHIVKTRTTPYHPASNAQVERINRTILQIIRAYLKGNQRQWDDNLQLIAGAIRATINRSTGFTPNRMMLGREVMEPVDLMLGLKDQSLRKDSPVEYVQRLEQRLKSAHTLAKEHLLSAQRRQKKDYDLKVLERKYSVGDLVYLINSSTKIGQSNKLKPIWKGPFVITKVVSPVLYRIQGRKIESIVHHDRLKLCQDRTLPMWIRKLRHKILELDETLPYDEDEDVEEIGLAPLFDLPTDQEDTEPDFHDVITSTQTVQPSDAETQDDTEWETSSETETEVIPIVTTQSRAGRIRKKPTRLKDYVS